MSLTQVMIDAQNTMQVLRKAMDAEPPANLLSAFFALQSMAAQVVIEMRNEGFFSPDGPANHSVIENWMVDQAKIALNETSHAEALRGKQGH